MHRCSVHKADNSAICVGCVADRIKRTFGRLIVLDLEHMREAMLLLDVCRNPISFLFSGFYKLLVRM